MGKRGEGEATGGENGREGKEEERGLIRDSER